MYKLGTVGAKLRLSLFENRFSVSSGLTQSNRVYIYQCLYIMLIGYSLLICVRLWWKFNV